MVSASEAEKLSKSGAGDFVAGFVGVHYRLLFHEGLGFLDGSLQGLANPTSNKNHWGVCDVGQLGWPSVTIGIRTQVLTGLMTSVGMCRVS
jgi:hypothetical protein